MMTTTTDLRLIDLDEQQRTSFRERGYCIVPGALDADEVERARSVCDRIAEEGGPRGRYVDPRYEDKLEYRDIVSLDPVFREIMVNPRVFPLIARLLGPNMHLISSHFIYKMSRPDTGIRRRGMWHRDVLGVTHDLGFSGVPMMSVRAGYYLTPVDEQRSGITLFAPGSNLLEEPLVADPHKDDPPVVLRPPVAPGDAVIWENRTYHAVEENTSGRTRKALMFQYGFRWLRPFDYISHSPQVLADCDPVQHQLLAAHDVTEDGSIARATGGETIMRMFEEQQVTWDPRWYPGRPR
jgi:ectoine hydroxylase-related dioxygenase (phytanoyl-CoA dioxygenase family)